MQLSSLWHWLEPLGRTQIVHRGITSRLCHDYLSLRTIFPEDPRGLTSFKDSLRYRTVSVASDEPLLIGSLLNLDVKEILKVPTNTRMEKMWSLMTAVPRGVPPYIIFRDGSKLTTPGYRWAPATLLNCFDGPDNPWEYSWNEDYIGTPSEAGHLVHLSGCFITMPTVPCSMLKPFSARIRDEMTRESIYCRNREDGWFLLSRYKRGQSFEGTDVADILWGGSENYVLLLQGDFQETLPDHSPTKMGRLARRTYDLNGVIYVRSPAASLVGSCPSANCLHARALL